MFSLIMRFDCPRYFSTRMMAQVAQENVFGLLSDKQMGPVYREAGLTVVKGRKKERLARAL